MEKILRMILPKGHPGEKVVELLGRIGLRFSAADRSYRPACSDGEVEAKFLRPQNIPRLVELGRHDCGFTGLDWVVEENADVVELMDLGLDPVRIVAAVPEELVRSADYASRELVVASEYRKITMDYIEKKKLNCVFVQSYGATEALPPEDADMIIENTSTGTTLEENRLVIVEEIMKSTTRFICNKEALEDQWKKRKLDEICMLMKGALNADRRVLLEMNVPGECFEAVVAALPCMKAPTVSGLHNEEGYAVKAAVPVDEVPGLIPKLKEMGARDILEYKLEKIVE
ncbi:MAG: ATP phosphoribosyltransferase [Planctomycetes bacterium B3_Pla]|nr:MAG: ATP phosphoribosyltransferase [Planctomycetes bacterium B3_Pla]